MNNLILDDELLPILYDISNDKAYLVCNNLDEGFYCLSPFTETGMGRTDKCLMVPVDCFDEVSVHPKDGSMKSRKLFNLFDIETFLIYRRTIKKNI